MSCMFLLGLTFAFHILFWYVRYGRWQNRDLLGDNYVKFHKSPYLRTIWGFLLFSHNSVTNTVFTFLKVLFTQIICIDCISIHESFSIW